MQFARSLAAENGTAKAAHPLAALHHHEAVLNRRCFGYNLQNVKTIAVQ